MQLAIEKGKSNQKNQYIKSGLKYILDQSKSNDVPFLVFRYPGKNPVIISKKFTSQSSIIFAPFNGTKSVEIKNTEFLTFSQLSQYKPFETESHYFKNGLPLHHSNKSEFEQMVNNAKGQIQRNKIEKVVLSKVKKIDKSIEPIDTFFNLEEKYESAFVYCFYHPSAGLWIGASPEKLLEKKVKNEYHIHSIAGTKALADRWTKKELYEQKIVTDYITSRLSESGITNLDLEGPIDLKYGTIKHLKTSISFKTSKASGDILKHIHPTPAVCGIPVIEAKNLIEKIEGYDRSYYTGYIGIKNSNENHETYFVNLRCMMVADDNCYIYTGAGIVNDSVPQDEWDEVEAKAKTLIDCLSING